MLFVFSAHFEMFSSFVVVDVNLDEVHKEWEESGLASNHIKIVAEHYGIFSDLFGDAYFFPRVMLSIEYVQNEETTVPVYRGNIVKPREVSIETCESHSSIYYLLFIWSLKFDIQALKAPEVTFKSDKDSWWTLILTNPDGHLTEENSEYIHWFM